MDSKALPELVEEFLLTQRVARARIDYASYLRRRYIEFLRSEDPADLTVRRLTIDSAHRWRQHDLLPNVWIASHGTLVLKRFAAWLARKGYHRDPTNGRSVLMGLEVARPIAKTRKALSDDQLDAIWEALAERDHRERLRGIAYVHVLYATGLRRTDAGLILRKNLNLTTRWLTVSIKHGKGTVVTRKRLSRECVVAVEDYLNDPERPQYVDSKPEPLFISEDGLRFKVDGFGSWVHPIGLDIKELTGIPWTPSVMKATAEMHARSGILDPTLRRRVANLLLEDSDHDRAIELATQVLETRVREKSPGLGSSRGAPGGSPSEDRTAEAGDRLAGRGRWRPRAFTVQLASANRHRQRQVRSCQCIIDAARGGGSGFSRAPAGLRHIICARPALNPRRSRWRGRAATDEKAPFGG